MRNDGSATNFERYHRTMKNVDKLEHYCDPSEFEAAPRGFVECYESG